MRYEFNHTLPSKGSYVFADALKPLIDDIDNPETDEGDSLEYDIHIKWYIDITQTEFKLMRYVGVESITIGVSGDLNYFDKEDNYSFSKPIDTTLVIDDPDKILIEFMNMEKNEGVTEEYSIDSIDVTAKNTTVYF